MYDELVKSLRDCAKVNSLSLYKRGLMKQAADAIEELNKTLADHDEMLHAYRHVCNGLSPDEVQKRISQPRWISVEERLPDAYTWVLVSAENHKVAFDAFYDGDKWKDAVLNELIVTHWQPLPEPPKEET